MEELLSVSHQLASCLEVVLQTSSYKENIIKNGTKDSIHVVVKNSPFQLSVALRNNKISNFNHLSFDMKLVYDADFRREVRTVTIKPIEYKTTINDLGDEITFDIKIKVLSSHHDCSLFRIWIGVWDPNDDIFPQLEIASEPIKVISKPVKRRSPTRGRGTQQKPQPSPETKVDPKSPPNSHKRKHYETLMQTIERIEQQQTELLGMLKQVLPQLVLPQATLQDSGENFIDYQCELSSPQLDNLIQLPLVKKLRRSFI